MNKKSNKLMQLTLNEADILNKEVAAPSAYVTVGSGHTDRFQDKLSGRNFVNCVLSSIND